MNSFTLKTRIYLILVFIAIFQPTFSTRCLCGKSNVLHTRIVGGVNALSGEFPWLVALTEAGKGHPSCGGSLLNNRYVVTAAHCIYAYITSPSSISVVLGEYDWTKKNANRLTIPANELILHEKFNIKAKGYDIGLIRLNYSIIFTDAYRPACLISPEVELTGVNGVVAGWGILQEYGKVPETLRKLNVPIISWSECQKALSEYPISSSQICGLYAPGGQDSCWGDSGGPLTYYKDGRFYLIGLVSWGIGCAHPNSPTIYTRVSSYYSWLDKNMKDDIISCND